MNDAFSSRTFVERRKGDYLIKNAIQREEVICMINPTSVATWDFGVPVVITGYNGNTPIVDKATATSIVYGFTTVSNNKIPQKGREVSINRGNSEFGVQYLLIAPNATVAAGDELEYVPASDTVQTKTSTNTVIGIAKEKGVAGDLIPVYVKSTY